MRNRGFIQRTDEVTELTYNLGKRALRSLADFGDASYEGAAKAVFDAYTTSLYSVSFEKILEIVRSLSVDDLAGLASAINTENEEIIQETFEPYEDDIFLPRTGNASKVFAEDATTMVNPGSSSDNIEPMGWSSDESQKEKEEESATGKPKVPPAASELTSPEPEESPQLIEIKINPQTRDVHVNYVPSPDEILADVPGAKEEELPAKEVMHEPKQPQEFQELDTSVGY